MDGLLRVQVHEIKNESLNLDTDIMIKIGAWIMIAIGITGLEKESGIVGMYRNIVKKAGLRVNIIESYSVWFESHSDISMKEYLKELEKNQSDIVVIKITPEKLEKGMYKDVKFDILVYDNIIGTKNSVIQADILKHEKAIFDAMNKEDIAIVNIDNQTVLKLLEGSKMCVITYGLSSKATIIPSSIKEEADSSTFIYCLQRTINTIEKKSIEPQEFPVTVASSKDKDIYNTLAAVTTALVCNVDASQIQDILL